MAATRPAGEGVAPAQSTEAQKDEDRRQAERMADERPESSFQKQPSIGDYFRWRPLPWWICFLMGIFLLTKLQLVYNDSPCAVLGTPSPVNMSDIKRAFRALSMCTHPDRLRGRLGRSATPAEERRGEILFNRASAAKDDLTQILKYSRKSEVQCYEGELELAVLAVFTQVGAALGSLGVWDYVEIVKGVAWDLVTFEHGFFNSILSILWFMFVFRIIKQFAVYLWRMGAIRGSLAVVTTVIIGPLPTLLRFLTLPVYRLVAFVHSAMHGPRFPELEGAAVYAAAAQEKAQQQAEAAAAGSTPAGSKSEKPTASTANMEVAQEGPNRGAMLHRRKKKETEEEKEKRRKDLLMGEAEAKPQTAGGVPVNDPTFGAGPMPENLWKCVTWLHREPVRARQLAATAVQFDLLLILTKPVIPLFMLIALGQVWNGLFSSIFIGHALRRWVPQMSYESHHLLCTFFGVMHTLLGVTSSQVEDYANRDGQKILHLAWTWSFKDVLSVVHMAQLGATVTAMSALGNEPSYAASFASGIALRIAMGQDWVRGLGVGSAVSSYIEGSIRDLGISFDAAEEVVAYSGQGIGDCGGGPFRMLFGDGPQAQIAAMVLKTWLLLLPLCSTLQWFQRTVHAGRMLGKRWKTTRFVQRAMLFLLGAAQCVLIARCELNASNGALGNFWVAMLFGCVGESLLSTYDIRGPVKQVFFLVMFLFI